MGQISKPDRYLEVARRLEKAQAEFDTALKDLSKATDAAQAQGFRDMTEMQLRSSHLDAVERRLRIAKEEFQLMTGGPAPVELTPRVLKVVRASFTTENQAEVIRRLESEVARNLPFCENSTASDLERLRLAVLKLAAADMGELRRQIETAKFDWYEVLNAADEVV